MNLTFTLAASFALLSGTAAAQTLPRRAFVGINLQGLNDSIQRRYHLPDQRGILVTGVREQSSAQAAGLLPNDVVRQVDKTPVQDVPQFVGLLKQFKTGDQSTFTLLRNGKTLRKKLTFTAFPAERSPHYTVEYGAVQHAQNRLRTIITRPTHAAGPKVPLVLFIQGVGCYSIDNPLTPDTPERRIIDSLSRHGYATLRVDKTGMGDSQGIPCLQADLRTETGGYRAGLAAARQLPWVDADNVFITGFSIGGVLAPLVAEDVPVKGIVTWGTASRSFIEYLLHNKRNQSTLAGMPYDKINEQQQLYAAVLHLLLTEKQTPEQVLARYPNAGDLLRFPQHYSYMQQWQDLNLAAAWQRLNTRVLALRGAADYISYSEDQQLLVDVVNRAHPGQARFQLLPDVDHGFTRARDMPESLRLSEAPNPAKNFDFVNVIIRWLDETRQQKS
ncbi:alpha/beta fold hydrolase [Hymenobacter busanensis]|uniref:Alpha/beta fold hydrolase n=1 Tax=Hymenobacter busanensis TaxID=2607656 RepID=A0A7L5A0V7_9BACT|nr:alpha/beta fold hydrolase [Hymenobacter busanensis]KAA9333271.1 alpha/beta fold hydrolase [Hymenobacter busanensis]QHJ08052.1 PDZ domain-containing protein [Hymenobacter busanensis]